MDRLMLKPSEIAEALGVSKTTVYGLVADGVLPSVRVSEGTIRIPAAAFRKWLAAREATVSGGVTVKD
jgi:excisionase family DNA binding protein